MSGHVDEQYERLGVLGAGTYGVVHRARNIKTGVVVALKIMKVFDEEGEGVPSSALREIAALRLLKHPNIVGLLDVEHDVDRTCLVFEFVERDLRKYLVATVKEPVDFARAASFAQQLLRGIDFCHGQGVIHRDLKPENVLVNSAGNLKIADFGLARAFALPVKQLTHEVVTLWYRAPEILMGATHYSVGVDTWAAGCIIAELFRRKPLWAGDSEIDTLFRMFQLLGTPTDGTWPGVTALPHFAPSFPKWPPQRLTKRIPHLADHDAGLDLVKRLLTYDPAARISARLALQHPYFQEPVQSAGPGPGPGPVP